MDIGFCYNRSMGQERDLPIIVGFVSDLMFTTRIANVARHVGFHVEWVESQEQFGQTDPDGQKSAPGEVLDGAQGELLYQITKWQPALLLFDLANERIPWRRWIPMLRSSPATSRIPILCFGPHVDVEAMGQAKRSGADAVLARSRFSSAMPQLLQQYAFVPDHDAQQLACDGPLSAMAQQGIDLHNQGEYFAAHEALEEAWKHDQGPGRLLYRALLQISVTFLQIERGNYRGAIKMCLRVRHWLAPLPAVCRGIDVAAVREIVESTHDALIALGPDRLGEFDKSLFRPFKIVT